MFISKDVQETFPEVFAFALHVTGLEKLAGPDMANELASGAAAARAQLAGLEQIADHPSIAVWRRAFGTAGVKPSKFRSSVEALARRAVRDDLPSVHPLVDLYNAQSLRHLVPLGASDADLLPGEVVLRMSDPASDHFEPLGSDADQFPLRPTIPVYASGRTVLCWCFNCRDAAPTSLRPTTANAVFFTEGVEAWQRKPAEAALQDLGQRLADLGAKVSLEAFTVR